MVLKDFYAFDATTITTTTSDSAGAVFESEITEQCWMPKNPGKFFNFFQQKKVLFDCGQGCNGPRLEARPGREETYL